LKDDFTTYGPEINSPSIDGQLIEEFLNTVVVSDAERLKCKWQKNSVLVMPSKLISLVEPYQDWFLPLSCVVRIFVHIFELLDILIIILTSRKILVFSMTTKSSKSTNPGPIYHSAGAPIEGHPFAYLADWDRQRSSNDNVTRIDVVRLFSVLTQAFQIGRRIQPRLYRVFVPASDLYDLFIEVGQELLFLISAEHRRSAKKNFDIKFSKDEIDELGNPRSWEVKPKRIMVASDELELKTLQFILENLISMKRNRRPLRSFQMPPSTEKKNSQEDKQKKRRQRYLYSRKQIREAQAFYDITVDKGHVWRPAKGQRRKAKSTEPWYHYIA
jgi:hypothetical protein